VAAGYLAAGFSADNIIFFKQSDVPSHTELAWVFDCITTMPYLMRAHAYKDAEANNREINVGVFNYPMLMAADILLYDTNIVPVGADQKQHVEYARDTAEKFNRIYGDTFILPEPKITDGVGVIPGIDGRKMSKSYKNVIPLFADSEKIKSQIMSIVTDSKGSDEPKDPNTCNIFALHKLITPHDSLSDLEKRYKEGTISYKESKEVLFEHTEKLIAPMRERYQHLINNKDELIAILNKGGAIAREVADKKMIEVRKRIGVSF
jgi:tryptophanyl-tRNA synthetase